MEKGSHSSFNVKQYNDGIFIDFGGSPYYVEHHVASVQIWRDKDGRIVSIDIVYEDDSDVAEQSNLNSSRITTH
ncbi:MAG: hypothetical protein OWQ50_02795 [Acidianus infernus]|nr:hypothetical protein [Acidianus infernus]